jgi:hypothetical protein
VGTQNLMAYSHDPASGRQCAAAPGRMRLSEDCHCLRRSLSRLIRMRLRYRGAFQNAVLGIDTGIREFSEKSQAIMGRIRSRNLIRELAVIAGKYPAGAADLVAE